MARDSGASRETLLKESEQEERTGLLEGSRDGSPDQDDDLVVHQEEAVDEANTKVANVRRTPKRQS